MKDYRSKFGLAVVASAVLLAGCIEQGARSTEQFQKSWSASEVKQLRVESVNGRVTVDASDQPTVNLTAVVRKYVSSKRMAQDYVTMELDNGVLEIRDRPIKRHFRIFSWGDATRIDYHVTLPANIPVKATTVNGKVFVHGTDAPISVVSVNGSVEVSTPTGEVEGKTVNGSVRATFTKQFRGARLKTVNGSVRVSLPRNASVACDVNQVNGSFVSNIPVTIKGHGEDISTATSGGKFPLVVTTVNGSVVVNALSSSPVPEVTTTVIPQPPAPPTAPLPTDTGDQN